jgi:hypothetical protein
MHNVYLNLVKYIDRQKQNTEKLPQDIAVVSNDDVPDF